MPIDFENLTFLAGDRMPVYASLRDQAPVHRLGADGPWVLTRYADIQLVLRQRDARVQPPGLDAPAWMEPGPARERMRANLAQTDDPVHARLRAVVGPLFVPRRIEAVREVSAVSVARAIEHLPADGQAFDLVNEVSAQVPRGVICHLLGIPESDWAALVAVQHDFLHIFSPFALQPEQKRRLDDVVRYYRGYFSALLDKPQTAQSAVLAPLLLEAETQGQLSREETISLMHTVLDAGYETTRTSISNAVELLAQQPDLHEQLRADPALIPQAVDEILRYRTPIHVRHRFLAQEHAASDGTVLPAGAEVLLVLAAANRDAEVFENADVVDLRRSNANRHLAFGGGLHHCLGAPLARIQLQETLSALTARYRRFLLPEGPGKRYPSIKFPSLMALRVVGQP